MYISKISLVNYRNFKNAAFYFNKGINTIIGENGSGKTNLFRAIRLMLDDDLLKFAYKFTEADFNRTLDKKWKGHWIIISLEFSEISADESIQAMFIHGLGNGEEETVDKATYNLFFRPKSDIRYRLSELAENDTEGLAAIVDQLTIANYESFFTGKSSVDFNDPEVYKELVGDFDAVKFNLNPDTSLFGARIPHQLSISKDISFTFIKALRDVVSDFNNNRTNPLMSLLKIKSELINDADYAPIAHQVKDLNAAIEQLPDVQDVRENIKETIKDTVGETYSPSSLSIKSSVPDDAEKLLQSLKLFIGEPDETYEGSIHELSLGGANLIFLTLKLLEFKYQRSADNFANFLLIEEPEAHIHTHIQKTLFDNLNYEDTQIIYSTHSTFISESSNISNINILSKKVNYAESFQPANNLPESKVHKLQRYLDAVRSNLLFAKGVMLIEGDAEAILIPLMVKKVFGISLDELGISLINIGSTGFENIAQIFHEDRVQRKCSIVTDLDQAIADTTEIDTDTEAVKTYKKKLAASEKSGKERQEALDLYITGNIYLKACYADYTFEVDFMNQENKIEILNTIPEVYKEEDTIELAATDIGDEDIAISGKRVLAMAKYAKKGWYALILGKHITFKTNIPPYILDAIVFSKTTLSRRTILSLLDYRLSQYRKDAVHPEFLALELEMEKYGKGDIALQALIASIHKALPNDQIKDFLERL
ncbi:ATP-dependent endonuclease [Pedobacter sp. Leaf216]|uniref:ATP-dependent nuclease n=1 Tax=Pedobacter sp. Leaf216 TaxID=1735684 RepID=UPI0006F85839|nr:AAA family ATPase [Pedobacter sp. Leaf216]KQM79197.1 ATP-dependent endonuclease [Pedobacter sp. Leaf216]